MPHITDTKPMKHTTGATFMRIGENISGSKCVASDAAPVIITKPITTISMLMPIMMKFIFPNAKFSSFKLLTENYEL